MVACFIEPEGKYTVFAEGVTRGYQAALLDWPRFKGEEERLLLAQAACEDMRAEVCCIAEDEDVYAQIVRSAWMSGYGAVPSMPERDLEKFALALKEFPADAALRLMRPGFQHGEGRAYLETKYADCRAALRYIEAMRSAAGNLDLLTPGERECCSIQPSLSGTPRRL